jgi:hypothetical protein
MDIKLYEEFMNDKENFHIFCDMDGVLTNFEKRFKEIEANTEMLSPHEYDSKYGKWSIWKLIEPEGKEWWSNMEWMPDGIELWSYLTRYRPTILSAPSKDPNSSSGKLQWINNNLNITQKFFTINPKKWKSHYRVIFNSKKYLFVRSKYDILIDDTYEKIEKWRNAGGTAIHHKNTKDTIKQLNQIINQFNS